MRSSCRCRRCTRERRGQSASSFGLGKREFLAKLNLKQLLNYRRQFRSHQLQALSLSLSACVCLCVCAVENGHTAPLRRPHGGIFSFACSEKNTKDTKNLSYDADEHWKHEKRKKKQRCLIWHNRAIAVHACTCVCARVLSHAGTHAHTHVLHSQPGIVFVCLLKLN